MIDNGTTGLAGNEARCTSTRSGVRGDDIMRHAQQMRLP